MISVNLVSKKKKVTKSKSNATMVFLGIFGLFVLYFLYEVISLAIGMISASQKLSKIKTESEELSSQILKDNDKLNRYILSKYILLQIRNEKAKKFDYLGLLDNVLTFVPDGSSLRSVDFNTKGFVSVIVTSDNDLAFRSFEDKIRSGKSGTKDDRFSSVLVESVSRISLGNYSTSLLFGLNKKDVSVK